MFKTKTFEIIDKFIPTKILKERRSVSWFSYKLRRMTRRKARLYKHAKKNLNSGQNLNHFNDNVRKHSKKRK